MARIFVKKRIIEVEVNSRNTSIVKCAIQRRMSQMRSNIVIQPARRRHATIVGIRPCLCSQIFFESRLEFSHASWRENVFNIPSMVNVKRNIIFALCYQNQSLSYRIGDSNFVEYI
jgi:hypothetical protein